MQQVEAKLQRSSSSSSITEDDDAAGAGVPSVFLFLRYYRNKRFSIQQLQLNEDGLPPLKERVRIYVAMQEEEDRHIEWFFSPPTTSTGDLYVLPKWDAIGFYKPKLALKFNFQTLSIQNINPTLSPICNGKAVNLGGRLYFLELYPDTAFQCYDPATDSWKPLKPFPDSPCPSRILATAVLSDTILFNVAYLYPTGAFVYIIGSRNMWAYDVCENEWYPVDDGDNHCCSIEGDAVVVDDTIYAFTSLDSDSVLALSIKKIERGRAGPKFTCSAVSRIRMKGMTAKFFQDETWCKTRQLVHLGKDDFCLVQSCRHVGMIQHQPLHLTYIKREGNSMKLMRVHELEIEPHFEVLQAFSLPNGMTFALEKGNRLLLQLDAFFDIFEPKQKYDIDSDNTDSDNTDSDREPEVVKLVQEDGNMALPTEEPIEDEGHSIHVENLSSNVNDPEVVKRVQGDENNDLVWRGGFILTINFDSCSFISECLSYSLYCYRSLNSCEKFAE